MTEQPERKALKDLLIVFSLVNLCFLRVWRELIHSTQSDLYWQPTFTVNSYIAILINIVFISLSIWFIAQLVRRGNRYLDSIARIGFLAAVIFPLNYIREVIGIKSEAFYWLIANPAIGIPVLLAVGFVGLYLLGFRLKLLSRVVAVSLLIFSPYVLLTTGQALVKIIAMPATILSDSIEASESVGQPANNRVLWIVFDEFDLRLAFLERPESVQLPHFDKLREESLFATNSRGHSKNTLEAIPSLVSGHLVKSVNQLDSVKLALTYDGGGTSSPAIWGEQESIFSRVSARGEKIAVTGIYHPYCRIFHEHLSFCRQFMLDVFSSYTKKTILKEMVSQLRGITPLANRLNGIDNYHEILRNATQTAADPAYGLVYVHASVPHGPDIFDGKNQLFSLFVRGTDGYFGNLSLADRFLGDIRQSMETAGLWDSTTIIITSDHEWRRSKNFDGVRIDKIPFIVKLANAGQGTIYTHEFSPLTVTKPLIEGILNGDVTTIPELEQWLDNFNNN